MPNVQIEITKTGIARELKITGKNKFYADSFVCEDEDFSVLLNGVTYNLSSLNVMDNFKVIIDLYKKNGDEFFNYLRGSFCGALHDKKLNKWLVFTNHIGDQSLYYAIADDGIRFGSDVFNVVETLRDNGKSLTLNVNAAYSLISYGYLISDETMCCEVKRLTAGRYVKIYGGKIQVKTYYSLDNQLNSNLSDVDCIDGIDAGFRNAVKLEYDKDLMYGFKHLSSMSGGLDCRMSTWVAHAMGYRDVVTYTFAQYGSLDMALAHDMSAYLGLDWIFKSLDHGNYLNKVDEVVSILNGQSIYHGAAHVNYMMADLNLEEFGLVHTGQLGDVIISTFNNVGAYSEPFAIKASSKRFINKVELNLSEYKNREIANLNTRAYQGALSGNLVIQKYTEVASAFTDVDFMNYCLSIPAEKRAYHNIYKKWILEKYPDAATFKWENTNSKINEKHLVVRGKQVALKNLPKFLYEGIMLKLGVPVNYLHSKFNMNPFEYWIKENRGLRNFFSDYFSKHIDLIKDSTLSEDCQKMFAEGSAAEKMQVLTLLSVIKQMEL